MDLHEPSNRQELMATMRECLVLMESAEILDPAPPELIRAIENSLDVVARRARALMMPQSNRVDLHLVCGNENQAEE